MTQFINCRGKSSWQHVPIFCANCFGLGRFLTPWEWRFLNRVKFWWINQKNSSCNPRVDKIWNLLARSTCKIPWKPYWKGISWWFLCWESNCMCTEVGSLVVNPFRSPDFKNRVYLTITHVVIHVVLHDESWWKKIGYDRNDTYDKINCRIKKYIQY